MTQLFIPPAQTKNADELRNEYLTLLDKGEVEQIYQTFIEENTRLVPRDFVQNHGVHLQLVLRKLAFGADYKSDFFFLSKSSDDWNAVFIEIEKPTSRFFKDGSNEFHPNLLAAYEQMVTWRAWLDAEGNQKTLLNQLEAVRVPTTMARNPTRNKFVLVLGRRAEYEGNVIRRGKIRGLERDDFKIITFDSLAEGLSSRHDLYLGVRRNESIDVRSHEVLDDTLFRLVDPSLLTVTQELHDKIKQRVAQNTAPLLFGKPPMSHFPADAIKVPVK